MSVINQAQPKTRTKRSLAPALGTALIILAVGATAWFMADGDSDVASPANRLEVVEEHVTLRASGDMAGALELLHPALQEEERDFYEALEVWNVRGTQATPCVEVIPGTYRCELQEENDFLAAVGLSPWNAAITFSVDESASITGIRPSVLEFPEIVTFDRAFREWMDATHPEESLRMSGEVSSGTVDADDARIALQYVGEFAAQSDRYPLGE